MMHFAGLLCVLAFATLQGCKAQGLSLGGISPMFKCMLSWIQRSYLPTLTGCLPGRHIYGCRWSSSSGGKQLLPS